MSKRNVVPAARQATRPNDGQRGRPSVSLTAALATAEIKASADKAMLVQGAERSDETEACCKTRPTAKTLAARCPDCGARGRGVGRATVAALTKATARRAWIERSEPYYCSTHSCPVVYYDKGDAKLGREDLLVLVGAKDDGLDVPLCYCFGHTRRSIRDEVARTGRSSAASAIAEQVRAGHCSCLTKNPSGRCCLGEVRGWEKEVQKRSQL